MTEIYYYKSPWKDKDASTVKDSENPFINEYEDEKSDSDKKGKASKEPITDTHVRNKSIGTTSVDSAVIGVRIIERGGRGITQGLIRLVPFQDVHFFYTRSHLSALQNCALLFSTNFQLIFILKKKQNTI